MYFSSPVDRLSSYQMHTVVFWTVHRLKYVGCRMIFAYLYYQPAILVLSPAKMYQRKCALHSDPNSITICGSITELLEFSPVSLPSPHVKTRPSFVRNAEKSSPAATYLTPKFRNVFNCVGRLCVFPSPVPVIKRWIMSETWKRAHSYSHCLTKLAMIIFAESENSTRSVKCVWQKVIISHMSINNGSILSIGKHSGCIIYFDTTKVW